MIRTITNYTFNVVAYNDYEVTLNDFTSIDFERFYRIYNLTQNIPLYEVNPNDFRSPGYVTGNKIVMTLGQPPQNNTDLLHIEYDDPTYDVPQNIADGHATVTSAGTPVQLTNAVCKTVCVATLPSNNGTVVIGSSDVVANASTRKGIPVSAGGTSIDIDNVNKLYIDSTVSGDGVSWLVLS